MKKKKMVDAPRLVELLEPDLDRGPRMNNCHVAFMLF